MAHFEATVRIFDVAESNAPAARRVVQERLRAAGFTRWQVVRIGPQGATTHRGETSRRIARTDLTYAGGGLLVAAVVAWALWFLWLLGS